MPAAGQLDRPHQWQLGVQLGIVRRVVDPPGASRQERPPALAGHDVRRSQVDRVPVAAQLGRQHVTERRPAAQVPFAECIGHRVAQQVCPVVLGGCGFVVLAHRQGSARVRQVGAVAPVVERQAGHRHRSPDRVEARRVATAGVDVGDDAPGDELVPCAHHRGGGALLVPRSRAERVAGQPARQPRDAGQVLARFTEPRLGRRHRLGRPAGEPQRLEPQVLGRASDVGRQAIPRHAGERIEHPVGIAGQVGTDRGQRAHQQVVDRVVHEAGQLGGPDRQAQQAVEVAAAVGDDRRHGDRRRLQLHVAGGARRGLDFVDGRLDARITGIDHVPQSHIQQAQRRHVRPGGNGRQPAARRVDGERRRGVGHQPHRGATERLPVAAGDGDAAGAGQLAPGEEHAMSAGAQLGQPGRRDGAEHRLLPQLVCGVDPVAGGGDQRHPLGELLQWGGSLGHAGDLVVACRAEDDERAERGDHRLGQFGQHLLAQVLAVDARTSDQRQADERRPPAQLIGGCRVTARQAGHRGDLRSREPEVGGTEHRARTRRLQSGEGHVGQPPAGEQDVAVGRQVAHEAGEQVLTGGTGRHELAVVDDQAHVERAQRHDRRDQRVHRRATPGTAVEHPEQRPGEVLGALAIRGARHPGVDAQRGEEVVADGLGQRRRLAEAGPGDDGRDRRVEPLLQSFEQIGAHELAGHRLGHAPRHVERMVDQHERPPAGAHRRSRRAAVSTHIMARNPRVRLVW